MYKKVRDISDPVNLSSRRFPLQYTLTAKFYASSQCPFLVEYMFQLHNLAWDLQHPTISPMDLYIALYHIPSGIKL